MGARSGILAALAAWLTADSSGNITHGNPPSALDNSSKLPTTQWTNAEIQAALFMSPGASVSANALTATLNAPALLLFRNPTLSIGTPVSALIAANLSIVVPSGATLGTVAGQQALLALIVAYNAGSPVLCIANLAGGLDLSETGLISPTTISSSATSAAVIYSASAVAANSPFRVVGFIQISEATAGTWASAPTLVQGTGGEAFNSLQSIGFGQVWQSVAGSRAFSTTYYNTTGRPIAVAVAGQATSSNLTVVVTVNGVSFYGGTASASTLQSSAQFIVPPGGSYSVAPFSGNTGTVSSWLELR